MTKPQCKRTRFHDGEGLFLDAGARAHDCRSVEVELIERAGLEVDQRDGGLVGRDGHEHRWAQLTGAVD